MIYMFLLAIQAAPASFDAVAAAPDSHRVLLEDADVRVLRVEVRRERSSLFTIIVGRA